ncbi:hypothetical protein HAX54_039579 [Datura stramonium]|uniref:Uncharacterized protein n=1 Tax=Datura stramonium TaxID=4076 RepID=A0ABS8SJ21_DATST|nr:hypothetical protein [Datura stramonium]
MKMDDKGAEVIKEEENIIALESSQIETVKDNQKMLRLENEMLQIKLDNVTERFNLCTARTDEMKLELKRLNKLAKTQEE